MYLRSLTIEGYKNFREPFEMQFSKGLNVLVGENAVGKSAIIDAIRLLLLEDEFGRNLVSESDFHKPFGKGKQPTEFFQIQGVFSGLAKEESVAFLPWLDENDEAKLTLHVENKMTSRGRLKWEEWGGVSRSTMFERELFDTIHCIYLPPLRDAETKLREGKGSRLARLLRNLNKKKLNQEEDHPLERAVKDFNAGLPEKDDSIKEANKRIQERLKEALGSVFGQETRIQYSEINFTRIVENLRLLFYPDLHTNASVDMFRSLDQNSLGYNNLLYLATVLAELAENSPEDPKYVKVLLIEEPEAHLHPQLQVKLLKYLEQKADKENVQVIVTTHSPVVASSVSIDFLIHLSAPNSPKAVSLAHCRVAQPSSKFISRWLDVTKSTLLFAKGIILVEGIAEGMLIPELAKIVLREYNAEANEKNRLPSSLEEAGVSVINMNGIYFKHFMQLFCDIEGLNHEGKIPIRSVGITDIDPPKNSKPIQSAVLDGGNPVLQLIPMINGSEWARLYASKLKTFEYDLAMERANLAVMFLCAISLIESDGPIKKKMNQYEQVSWASRDEQEKSEAAYYLLNQIADHKGEFSQALATHLYQHNASLAVPEYIRQAIIWACEGKSL